jgi:GNAT superfamily N-acetyltransferase
MANESVELALPTKPALLDGHTEGDAFRIAQECFPKSHDRELIRFHYERIREGQIRFTSRASGKDIRLLPHFVYYRGTQAVGIGGHYRYEEERSRIWLSWFGVAVAVRRQGVGREMMRHHVRVAQSYGAEWIVGYTEADLSNSNVHRFYERCGFLRSGQYDFRGEAVYQYERALDGVA